MWSQSHDDRLVISPSSLFAVIQPTRSTSSGECVSGGSSGALRRMVWPVRILRRWQKMIIVQVGDQLRLTSFSASFEIIRSRDALTRGGGARVPGREFPLRLRRESRRCKSWSPSFLFVHYCIGVSGRVDNKGHFVPLRSPFIVIHGRSLTRLSWQCFFTTAFQISRKVSIDVFDRCCFFLESRYRGDQSASRWSRTGWAGRNWLDAWSVWRSSGDPFCNVPAVPSPWSLSISLTCVLRTADSCSVVVWLVRMWSRSEGSPPSGSGHGWAMWSRARRSWSRGWLGVCQAGQGPDLRYLAGRWAFR